jgi:hypothetical protein
LNFHYEPLIDEIFLLPLGDGYNYNIYTNKQKSKSKSKTIISREKQEKKKEERRRDTLVRWSEKNEEHMTHS